MPIQQWRLVVVVEMILLVVASWPGAAVTTTTTTTTTLSHSNHRPMTKKRVFRTTGPIITVTIPHDLTATILRDDAMDNNDDDDDEVEEMKDTKQRFPFWHQLQRTKRSCQSIWDTTLSLIQPSCLYTVQTMPGQLPLPHWCPALTSCAARWGYHVTTPTTSRHTSSSSSSTSSSSPSHTLLSSSSSNHQHQHQHHHRYSVEGLTKLEWSPKWCPVLQVAIQPHCEWTTSTSSHKKLIGTATKPTSSSSSSSSSVLFHAQTGNSNYAWLRLSTTTSSLPSATVSFEPLSNFENDSTLTTTTAEITPRTTDHIVTTGINRQHHDRPPKDVSEYQRTDEASIRASRFIPLPLATWSSCSITPTIRWIRRSPRQQQQQLSTDASCDLTLTSGGSGRTTATVTLAPWSPTNRNLALAMEYRLSGGFHDWCRWFRPPPWRTRNTGMTLDTPAEQPQHWIRQIWEWHPRRGSSIQNHSPSFSGIVASQYQWLTIFPSGQSIRTVFDPPSEWNHADGGLSVTWTDPTNHWNNHDPDDKEGTWITHLQIRLARHRPTRQSWLAQNFHASDVQVRRRFRF